MSELGLRMKWAQLERQHPEATEDELRGLYRTWLLESGDHYC